MKIITRSNHGEDLFKETVVGENIAPHYGQMLINAWNTIHQDNGSKIYLDLVSDDYVPYDGYADHV